MGVGRRQQQHLAGTGAHGAADGKGEVLAFTVMPGLVPGIHVFAAAYKKDVDGRDKPGHDNDREVRSQ
ncbi:hypothetical protein BE61_34900 [Bradyrhizobium elkanii USDA 61]|nr:hypothetical protein BE61_34900 [Bradyrhizobium elkanii USDA 61]